MPAEAPRVRAAIRWIGRLIAALAAAHWAAAAITVASLESVRPIAGIGNTPEVVARVRHDGVRPFRIAFIGDVNNVGVPNLRSEIRAALDGRPDLVVFGGDLVKDEMREGDLSFTLGELRRFEGRLPPTVVAPGNHDLRRGEGPFRAAFGAPEFAFRAGGARFVLLNIGRSDAEQADFLRSAIADRAVGEPLFIVTHYPFAANAEDERRRPILRRAVVELEPPVLVLAAHERGYREYAVGPHMQIIAGGTPERAGGENARAVAFIDVGDRVRWQTPPIDLVPPTDARLRFALLQNFEDVQGGRGRGIVLVLVTLCLLATWLGTEGRFNVGLRVNRVQRALALVVCAATPFWGGFGWERLVAAGVLACAYLAFRGTTIRIVRVMAMSVAAAILASVPTTPAALGLAPLAYLAFLEAWRSELERIRPRAA